MSPKPAISPERSGTKGGEVLAEPDSSLPATVVSQNARYDEWAAIKPTSVTARCANRALIFSLFLFALSIPHSIAAAQVSLSLGVLAWIMRDLAMRRFHFTRTPLDLPGLCFAALTVLSSLLSVEPSLSLPKLKALTLFAVVYLVTTNLHPRGVPLLAAALILSSLVGVGFSFFEKVYGRGMIITTIAADSPLLAEQSQKSRLQAGDVIWMIARHRIYTPEDAAAVIRRQRTGAVLDVEALHQGDPVPVALTVTDELKAQPNPLGITARGRSRQFRVSGFSRQFLTYAEQMQILALLSFGGVLAGVGRWRSRLARHWLVMCGVLFALFGLALVLTASRAIITSCIVTLLLIALGAGGLRAPIIALMAALMLGGLGLYFITATRQQVILSFNDDSTARRIGYMKAGLRLIPQHPLLGVGMDAHKRHWQEWGFPGNYVTHTHSTPIQIAMERGLLALGCYVWLLAAFFNAAWRGYGSAKGVGRIATESLLLGAAGVGIGFTLSSLTNYNFGDSEVLMLLLFVMGLAILHLPKSSPALDL